MSARRDFCAAGAAQNVDHMQGAKRLAGVGYSAKQHARLLAAIDHLGRAQAIIAIAAGFALFVEVRQQRSAATLRGVAIGQQRVEPFMLAHFMRLVSIVVFDELATLAHVGQIEQKQRFGWQAIAPRAAYFLIIGFHAAGQIQMADIANVGLVDAHAERNRGHHYNSGLGHEAVLVRAAHVRFLPGMIGDGVDARAAQKLGNLFGRFARQAINDARILALVFQKPEKLLAPIRLCKRRQPQVRAVKPVQQNFALAAKQALHNIFARGLVRRGREGGDRCVGKALAQRR